MARKRKTDEFEKGSVRVLAYIPRLQAALRPNDIALCFDERQTTYQRFHELSNRIANGLIAAGVKPVSRIAILDKNSDLYFEAMFGVMKANAVVVPINARLAPPEVAYIINDAQVEVLFVGEGHLEAVRQIRDQIPTVRKVIILNADFVRWRDAQSGADPGNIVQADDVCVQMYTSGTTGRPKGAQLTSANFMLEYPATRAGWAEWFSHDVLLMVMPLFHIAGFGTGILGMFAGLKTIICRDFSAADTLRMIKRHRISVSFLVPAMLLAMVSDPSVEEADISSSRLVIYGASPIPMELLRAALRIFKRTEFFQVYGLTETSGVLTILPPADHVAADPETMKSCGRPIAGVELKIVDDDGEQLAPGKVGEVVCRSARNTKGYWNLPEYTSLAIRDGWFYTGDAGYLNQKGYLFIYDRLKDMIVSGGENIYPAEIENAMFGHPDIADIAVIGVPDSKWGEAVKAFIVLRDGCTPDASKLTAYARERLAGYKVPKSIEFISQMPRNASGKVLKRKLREEFWKGYERQVN